MKRILHIFKGIVITGIAAIALTGCEVGAVMDPPQILPDPGLDDGEDDCAEPKRPVPIKPKRNPGGKIERPKLIEDLINKIITRSSSDNSECISYEDYE